MAKRKPKPRVKPKTKTKRARVISLARPVKVISLARPVKKTKRRKPTVITSSRSKLRTRGRADSKVLVPSTWKKDAKGRWRDKRGRVRKPTIRLRLVSGPSEGNVRVPLRAQRRAELLQSKMGRGRYEDAAVFFLPDAKGARRRWSISGFKRFMRSPRYGARFNAETGFFENRRRDVLAIPGRFVFGTRREDGTPKKIIEELFRGNV